MIQSWILPSYTLLQRELVRFFRQRNRIIGAFGTPIVFWILMGSGFSGSFRSSAVPGNTSAIEFLFPGTITMIVLFTSIFSTISIIEDRREGFLQAVLVSPVSQATIVTGKIVGGTFIAMIQVIIFLILGICVGLVKFHPASILLSLLVTLLMGFALTGLGFAIAWKMDSSQGFHAIMNLFLMPMWLLSGSLFPISGASPWLNVIMKLNPLTYGVSALRTTLYGSPFASSENSFTFYMNLAITIVFGLLFFFLCVFLVKKEPRKSS